MKLRNKKTGQIGDLMGSERSCPYITIGIDFHDGNPRTFDYTSLTELNDEWEDYKEPLIKDKKARKAVRTWAEANGIERVWHGYSSCWLRGNGLKIELENEIDDLEQDNYTIAELCGEEEE